MPSIALLLALAAGCGGRSLSTSPPDGDAGSTGAAGAQGQAGSTGAAGQAADAGQACGPCPAAVCKEGFVSVVDPTVSCCPVCRAIDCSTVPCAAPNCFGDNHLETPTGKCCAVCVAGPSESCNKGRAAHDVLRTALIDKYGSSPCKVDTDCALVLDESLCGSDCGAAISAPLVASYEGNLANASAACSSCPSFPAPPCADMVAVCSNGQCVATLGP